MNRSEFLKVAGIKYHDIDVDGIGVITLKEMSGGDRDEYFSLLAKADKIKFFDSEQGKDVEVPDIKGVKPFLISRLFVGDDKKPMFNESEVAEELTPEAMDTIFDKISELNGIDDKAIDDAEKN